MRDKEWALFGSSFKRIFTNIHNVEKENWDSERFNDNDQRRHSFAADRAVDWMKTIILHYNQFEQAYNLMEDEASRNLMLKILQFDVLDHHHVRMPLNDAD